MEKQIREIIAQHVGGTHEAKQKCVEEILRLFNMEALDRLLEFDKWCEDRPVEDYKLTSKELINKFLNNQ